MQLTGWNIINPVARLLICGAFTDIVVMIPSVRMENFLFGVSHIFRLFDADKAVALVFDLSSIKKTANTEESGLFGHVLGQLAKSFFNVGIKRFIG